MTTPRKKPPAALGIGIVLGVALLIGIGMFVRAVILAPAAKKAREVQNVQIVRPPPPPPENQPPPPPPPPDHEPEIGRAHV